VSYPGTGASSEFLSQASVGIRTLGVCPVLGFIIGLKSQNKFHKLTTIGLHPHDVALYHLVMPKVVIRPARPCQTRLMLIW
jgi:hypothetical protein